MPRVHRNADQLVKKNGWPTWWYQASLAPEVRFDGSQGWTQASGDNRGYIHEPPKLISVMFVSIDTTEDFDMVGAWAKGRCSGTLRVKDQIGNQDRLIPQRFPFRDNFTRQRSMGTNLDTCRDLWIDELLSIRLSADVQYAQGADYQLVRNEDTGVCQIEWLSGGKKPGDGEYYTVLAMIRPVWIVQSHPMIRVLRGYQLPWKCQLVRDDVSTRGGA